MTSDLLIHDVATRTAKGIVDVFAGCLREDELPDAFAEVYTLVKASLERYQILDNRMERRMRPGVN
ncbi:MAG TPA: hypothetical protein VE988_19775 [Gemmataceae bacterium]|nr:hypothetical protein [Gemmataceae bacterium]